jgi:hypothetical protein
VGLHVCKSPNCQHASLVLTQLLLAHDASGCALAGPQRRWDSSEPTIQRNKTIFQFKTPSSTAAQPTAQCSSLLLLQQEMACTGTRLVLD